MTTRTCRQTRLTALVGSGSLLLAADSRAASPLPGGQPLRDRAAGYESMAGRPTSAASAAI